MSGLVELVGRVEALTGQDDATDLAIAEWLYHSGSSMVNYDPRLWVDRNCWEPTGSLDAATTLVPEGWGWLVSQPNEKAIASGLLKERTPVLGEVQYGCDHRYAVAAATPALALCAAALKARSQAESLATGDRAK